MELKKEVVNWFKNVVKEKEFKVLYEHFLSIYIKKVEGMPCYADKVRFVIEKTKQALNKNENLSLYEEYKDKSVQAYWSPLSIKNVEEAVRLFSKWYMLESIAESTDILFGVPPTFPTKPTLRHKMEKYLIIHSL